MNTLRKRPTYDNLIYYLNHQPTIKHPARKGIRAINDPFIPNLLFTQITAVAEILTFLRMMAALDLFIELVTAKVLSITS